MFFLNLLFPRRCVSCGKLGGYFCKPCFSKIDYITSPVCPICRYPAIDGITHPGCKTAWGLDGMYAVARYKGWVRKAINLLKYKHVTDITDTLTDFLIDNYPKFLPAFDLLVPVPLHKIREKTRGFNQSLILAKSLSYKLGTSVGEGILYKTLHTEPQVKLKGKSRRTNLKRAFAFNKEKNISGKTIALVDDVATTRSTLLECAKLLKRNGAKSVWGIVLAHG